MRKYFSEYKGLTSYWVIVTIFTSIVNIYSQKLKGNILDIALSNEYSLLKNTVIILLISIILTSCLEFYNSVIRDRLIIKVMLSLKADFFKSLFSRSHKEFEELSEGDIIAKYTKQMMTIRTEYLAMGLLFLQYLILIISVTISMTLINIPITIVSIILLFAPMLTTKYFEAKLSKATKEEVEANQDHLKIVSGILKGIEAVKNYGIEDKIIKKYDKSNKIYKDMHAKENQVNSVTIGMSFFTSFAAQIIVTIYAAYMVYKGIISSGDFVTMIALVGVLKVPIYWLSNLYRSVILSKPSRQSIIRFIEEGYKKDIKEKIDININKYNIKYKDIDFSYGDQKLIQNLNMDLEENTINLIIGESGCGKSTAIKLLLGFIESKKGEILIGDHSVKNIKNLSSFFTIAKQEAFLFNGSMRENISLFEDISDDQIIEILKKVGLERYADRESLDIEIKESGNNFSGGEKKRISLARALLRKSPILILDEPLANIDENNMNLIEDLILSIKDRTVIIISHQFTKEKLDQFDKIYEFKGGMANEVYLERK
ncbi:MAG: ABC transporter ATP-binding protein [Tissierellia bacterium]|nr:ABC transporter ATP-binding protein [Tissierellia bacterium]